MDPSAAADYWKSMLPASQLPNASGAAGTQLQQATGASFIPDYAWHAATGFGLSTHMPFIPPPSSLPSHQQQPFDATQMGLKMDIKNEYGDTYNTSEMYAAGIASMGGEHHFGGSSMAGADETSGYDLGAASAMAATGNPTDLLMGLTSTTSADIHSLGPPPTSNLTKEQLNAQQEAIRAHPLYPFLTVLFERCELATSTPRDLSKEANCRQESAAEMFKDDLMHFVKTRQDEKMRFYVADPELDKLMLSAIQVLRLHLLELEKVHELCDHFCQRYINTLKDQMQMDMMHEERSSSAATNNASPTSPGVGPSSASHYQQQVYEPQIVNLPENMHPSQLMHNQSSDTSASTPNNNLPTSYDLSAGSQQQQHSSQQQHNTTTSSAAPTPGSATSAHTPSTNGATTHLPTHLQDLNKYQQQQIGESPHSRNGSTPGLTQQQQHQMMHDEGDDNLSIGGGSLHDDGRETPNSDGSANGHQLNSSGELQHHQQSTAQQRSASSSSSSNSKRKVPKVFPKDAITKFRAWLFANLSHPYPSEEQKKNLAQDTNLTILQVNNWFINARRRIVQPMIDSNNRAGRSPHGNAFRNRRRRNSEQSPAGSPNNQDSGNTSGNANSSVNGGAAAMSGQSYSPDTSSSASMMNVMAASAGQYPAAAMFPAPYGFPSAGFPSQMFMPNVVGAYGMNPSQMAPNWMDFGGGSMDS